MCQVSLKDMEPNRRGINLKIAGFLLFFKMSLFEIQNIFLAEHHGKNLNFALNYNVCNFYLQNDFLLEKQKIC